MANKKIYEEEGFRFEFTPNGSPLSGTLMTKYPELHPFTSEISQTKEQRVGNKSSFAQKC